METLPPTEDEQMEKILNLFYYFNNKIADDDNINSWSGFYKQCMGSGGSPDMVTFLRDEIIKLRTKIGEGLSDNMKLPFDYLLLVDNHDTSVFKALDKTCPVQNHFSLDRLLSVRGATKAFKNKIEYYKKYAEFIDTTNFENLKSPEANIKQYFKTGSTTDYTQVYQSIATILDSNNSDSPVWEKTVNELGTEVEQVLAISGNNQSAKQQVKNEIQARWNALKKLNDIMIRTNDKKK